MFTQTKMLLWERWRQTRWAVIAASLLPIIGRLMQGAGNATQVDTAIVDQSYLYPGYIILIMFLLMGQCEAGHLNLAFPKRLFRFPVSTKTLFVVYLSYGVVAVFLPFSILLGFENLFLGTTSYKWATILILETVYIALQTLSWLGGPARFLYLALSLAGVYALFNFVAQINHPMATKILCPIIILVCSAISFWSVSSHRHGAWTSGWKWVDSFLGIFRKKPKKRFSSALHAQIWFELRQTGHLFPIASLCVIGPMIGFAVGLMVYHKHLLPVLSLFAISYVFILPAALIAGLLSFAVSYRDHVSGASNFWLRRPISTRTLAVARLHAMVWSLARVIAILSVATLTIVMFDQAIGKLDLNTLFPLKWWVQGDGSPLEVVIMVALGLYGFFLFYWTLLRLAPALLVCGIVVFNITRLMMFLTGDVEMSWILNALGVGLPVAVLVAFYIAKRRNLVSTMTLATAACVFPVAVVSLWALLPWLFAAFGLSKGLSNLNQIEIIRLISAATLPFIPVVASPLLMERLRHR